VCDLRKVARFSLAVNRSIARIPAHAKCGRVVGAAQRKGPAIISMPGLFCAQC
jgi:hypothetical protein